MKARIIGGIREADFRDPLGGLWIQAVDFPMAVTNFDATEPTDPEEVTLHDEDDLHSWAERTFDELGYEIFYLEIPVNSGTATEGFQPRLLLDLISSKKAEYENAAPDTPQGARERDAVIAALDTLQTHARALL